MSLLEPAPDDVLDMVAISTRVNNVRNDGPELIVPVVEVEAPPLPLSIGQGALAWACEPGAVHECWTAASRMLGCRCMRTTVELRDDQHAALAALASRRGLRGYSSIVQDALDLYLREHASSA